MEQPLHEKTFQSWLDISLFIVIEGLETVQEARGKEGTCGCCHD